MGAGFVVLHPVVAMQFDFHSVSLHGIIQGAVAATGYYVGFDGIAALAVETKDPKHTVPRVLIGTVVIVGVAITASCFVQYPVLLNHADELAAGASPVAIFAHAIGWDWLAIVVDLLIVPATFAATVTVYNIGARIVATTAVDGLLPAALSRILPTLPHTPLGAVRALATVATGLTVLLQVLLEKPPLLTSVYLANLTTYYWLSPYFGVPGSCSSFGGEGVRDVGSGWGTCDGGNRIDRSASSASGKKPPLLTSVYLANLTTYYWLSPYFLVCVGILLILRREGVRDIATAGAAWVSMAVIVYVAIEMFRSPVDTGTTYLPYVAVVTIAAVALVFITTRTDDVKPARELERSL